MKRDIENDRNWDWQRAVSVGREPVAYAWILTEADVQWMVTWCEAALTRASATLSALTRVPGALDALGDALARLLGEEAPCAQ